MKSRLLCNGRMPWRLIEQHAHRFRHHVQVLIESEPPRKDRRFFSQTRDSAKRGWQRAGIVPRLRSYAELHENKGIAFKLNVGSACGAEVNNQIRSLTGCE